MAERTWHGGAGDNNWGTAGNWDTAPVGGDSVVITGSSDITAGLTPAIAIATWTRGDGCTAKIGSATAALTFTTITTINDSGRSSYTKLACSTSCATANFNIAPGCSVYVSGAGTWTTVNARGTGGDITLDSSSVVTNFRNQSPNVQASVSTSGTALTLFENSGRATCRRNVTTYTGEGGDSLSLTDAATMGTANLYRRSSYNHQSSGTITALNMHPGSSFPITGGVKPFTITDCTFWDGSYFGGPIPSAGGTTTTSGSGVQVTFTNAPTRHSPAAGGGAPAGA